MEKRYYSEINFTTHSIDLYGVTKDEILNTLKRKVEDEEETLTSIKWKLV